MFIKCIIFFLFLLFSFNSYSKVCEIPIVKSFKDLKENTKFEFKNQKFKNIFFFYDEKEIILENLNFDYNKNKFIGIFGDSGGGKTTFINLLLGLLRPKKGEILINDIKSEEVLNEFQKNVSYVPQDIYLIDSDIKENVALTDGAELSYKNLEEIKIALNKAEFVSNKDLITNEILNRKVGQKGINLSGGQLQRVGIARAFYRKSQILILDEATRSLDQTTEEEIIKNLVKKKNDITIIMISHNKNNFKYCDEIYEIKNRKIIKQDNHKLG